MRGHSKRGNREILSVSPRVRHVALERERAANVTDGSGAMNTDRKSDRPIVLKTPANKDAAEASTESVEGRGLTKRNAEQDASHRTQGRTKRESRGLQGVREAARKDSKLRFTALLHHIDKPCLMEAFYHVRKTCAVGVDGVTWHEYERDLENHIADLHDRIHRGAYRAKPARRAWIPKADGRQRPLGIPSLEDKIVQQAVLWVLQAIYEQDFLGFSYGFRPHRNQHQALDALSVAMVTKKVNWILDADIQGFFDNIDHDWLIKFLEHRIGDRRILRLIRKWLKAGIIEEGDWSDTTQGTPQGAVISPLLANVYLHYVFDLWIEWWRKQHCQGDVIVVRYADDFVMGFQHQREAVQCLQALHDRFGKFGLMLHEGKTRLIEFGRYAEQRRRRNGQGRPETFNFLGFTHICGSSRERKEFTVVRHTISKRLRATLQAVKVKLRRRMHEPFGDTARWLRRVAQGWMQYHAVPHNYQAVAMFLRELTRIWHHCLRRRSQRGRWTWARMDRVAKLYLPRPQIIHPYPIVRFRARLKVGAV